MTGSQYTDQMTLRPQQGPTCLGRPPVEFQGRLRQHWSPCKAKQSKCVLESVRTMANHKFPRALRSQQRDRDQRGCSWDCHGQREAQAPVPRTGCPSQHDSALQSPSSLWSSCGHPLEAGSWCTSPSCTGRRRLLVRRCTGCVGTRLD